MNLRGLHSITCISFSSGCDFHRDSKHRLLPASPCLWLEASPLKSISLALDSSGRVSIWFLFLILLFESWIQSKKKKWSKKRTQTFEHRYDQQTVRRWIAYCSDWHLHKPCFKSTVAAGLCMIPTTYFSYKAYSTKVECSRCRMWLGAFGDSGSWVGIRRQMWGLGESNPWSFLSN